MFDLNKNRLFIVYSFIVLGFVAVILRLLFVVIFSGEIDVNEIYNGKKISKRANIVDRNGVIIATDLDVKILYANSILIRDPKLVAKALSDTFPDLDYDKILRRLSRKSKKDGWVFIKRDITPKQEQEINKLGIAGLIFEESKVRVYPQRDSLSQILGYADTDGNGLAGIEKQYDDFLRRGNKDLQLAVDVRIQDVLNNQLKNALVKYKAGAAFGIIMDVNNGEIVALSSLPDFDLNDQSAAKDNAKFNRATYGLYELGSVFKIFTMAQAFEEKAVNLNESFSVKDPIRFGKFSIDDDHKDKDILTTTEVFTHSSNIGSVKIIQRIGPERQKKFLQKIGLLDKIKTDFPSLGSPMFPRSWREINSATIAFGHGIAVTPLHIVRSVAAVVNNGRLFNPSFIKLNKEPSFERVISENSSTTMRSLLQKVIREGTGKNSAIEDYEVGGKTGTAEHAESGSYNKGKTLASFVAAFPINNPRYVIYVGIDQPNYIFNTGGMVAAPVTGEVIKNVVPILDAI